MPKDIDPPPTSKQNPQKISYKKPQTELVWLEKACNTARGETALWVAVITQAMMDALSRCKKSEAVYQKHEAIRWLTGGSKDFNDVCLCAGLNPDYVRRQAKKVIAAPRAWRAEPGKGKRYQERRKYRAKQRVKAENSAKSIATSAQIIHMNLSKNKTT